MKCILLILIIILFALASCGDSNTSTNDLITVDVTASYPKKELILQDFMDVEYIPLETDRDFICEGFILAIGKDILLAKNRRNDGDIFIYDRKTGKGLKKINRKGQGSEEYTFVQRLVLDEEKGEIFVHDHFTKKMLVYDLKGNFKRSLHNDDLHYMHVYNFDRDHLICNNYFNKDREAFAIISKQDGSITKKIRIPFEEKKSIDVGYSDKASNMYYSVRPDTYHPIIPTAGKWVLVEQSSDTVYTYQPDHTMTPIIARTPSVQSTTPEVFLFPSILTDRYYFMEALKREYDFKTNEGFPIKDLLYDKEARSIFEYTVYNNDYSNKTAVNMKTFPVSNEIASCQTLDAHQLMEDYEEGKLKGQLKEIAAELNEESNPVIMLLKHKK